MVHCDEGDEILRSVAEENPGNSKILAITVLTSLNQKKLKRLGYSREYADNVSALVLLKARMAKAAGCQGVVCYGLEVGAVRREIGPDIIAVTPGIRPAWTMVHKDVRSVTQRTRRMRQKGWQGR